MAAAISAAASATPSQTGGVGIRQFGSRLAWNQTTFCESHNKRPATLAIQCQPVNTARKPTGTTAPISGTTKAFAESPEKPRR